MEFSVYLGLDLGAGIVETCILLNCAAPSLESFRKTDSVARVLHAARFAWHFKFGSISGWQIVNKQAEVMLLTTVIRLNSTERKHSSHFES